MGCRNECADGSGRHKSHKMLKRAKMKLERRRAKRDPECAPGYGRYRGYEL